MIFADTGAWFALFVAWDEHHSQTQNWFSSNREPLLTTDYVVAETLTLLRARRENRLALRVGALLFEENYARIHFLTPADIRAGHRTFAQFSDKA